MRKAGKRNDDKKREFTYESGNVDTYASKIDCYNFEITYHVTVRLMCVCVGKITKWVSFVTADCLGNNVSDKMSRER